jgi:methionyl-tRNA synthetase
MINQYRDGMIPEGGSNQQIAQIATVTIESTLEAYERFEFSKALEGIWILIAAVDKYIVEQAPWRLAKDPDAKARLDETLYSAAEALRIVTALLWPVLPESTAKIWAQLGCEKPLAELRVAELPWGNLPSGQHLGTAGAIFPRADAKLAIPKMQDLENEEVARQLAILGKTPEPVPDQAAPAKSSTSGHITIDDFVKIDLRVGVVKDASPVKGSDKLLHLHVDIGEPEPRSIVAGIALAYKPEELAGRKVVIVANLAPRKLKGVESQGMILAASKEGDVPVLCTFAEDVPPGARLK